MKKRILILDDKETIGKVLMMYLATEYDCTWFDNPLKGLDWMRQGNIPRPDYLGHPHARNARGTNSSLT